jgi:hypothetical protein
VFDRFLGAALAALFLLASLPRHAWNRLRTRKDDCAADSEPGSRSYATERTQSDGPQPARARDEGEFSFESASLGMRKGLVDPRGWTRFIGWLRRRKPDIVHAHLPHAAWLARWARLFAPAHDGAVQPHVIL